MNSARALRQQIEASLADRIPSALSPAQRIRRPIMPTGILLVDEILEGGLPVGAITEMVGAECSGRTALALSFLAQITQASRVCAWVDVSNCLHPESAAATGVDLCRLLWVRCGAAAATKAPQFSTNGFALQEKYFVPRPVTKGLHGGGFGPHPRSEVKGLSEAVSSFLRPQVTAPRCSEPQRSVINESVVVTRNPTQQSTDKTTSIFSAKPWSRLDQALRVTDLLLQAGGFSAIVLDMGSIAPEYTSRVPLATWFRYRAAAERSQTSLVLLTQHACAKSSAELALRFEPGKAFGEEKSVFTGVEYCVDVMRERSRPAFTNVIPLRKPPQRASDATWHSRTSWAGRR